MESVHNNAGKLNADLQAAGHFVQGLAATLEYCDYSRNAVTEILRLYLQEQVEQNPAVCGAAIAWAPSDDPSLPNGMLTAKWNGKDPVIRFVGPKQEPYAESEWFSAARNGSALSWSEPCFHMDRGDFLMTSCQAPFYRRDARGERRFAGVVRIEIDLGRLREFIQSNRMLSGPCYSALLSRHGTVIAHPDPRLSGRSSLLELSEKYPALKAVRNEIARVNEGMMYVKRTSILDEPVQYFFTAVPETGWTLVAAFPTRLIYEKLHHLLWILLGCTVGGTVILVLATSLVLRRSGTPLKQLAAVAGRIGKGDFATPLPEYTANDEIGYLNTSLRNMQ